MTITPPKDFWPPNGTTGESVLYATPPLYIASNTVYITDASPIRAGSVSTTAQTFAGTKTFTGITMGSTVTDISADSTFAIATDAQLSTKKAIKDYVATAIGMQISSVSDPLTVILGNLDIKDASATQDGIVTTGTQTFAGNKTLTGMLNSTSALASTSSADGAIHTNGGLSATKTIFGGNGLVLDNAATNYIYTPTATSNITLQANTNGSNLILNGQSLGGGMYFSTATTGADRSFSWWDGATGSLSMSLGGSSFAINRPTVITSTTQPQLYLQNGTNASSIYADPAGHISIKSGTAAGSKVRLVDGPTNTSYLETEGLVVTSYRPFVVNSATGPQLVLTSGAGNNVNFNVAAGGDLTIDAAGNDINMHSTDRVHVLNNTISNSKVTGAFTTNGGIGCDGTLYADSANLVGTGNHIVMTRNPGQVGTILTGVQGSVSIDSSGTTPKISLSFGGAPLQTFTVAESAMFNPLSATSLTSTNGQVMIGNATSVPTIMTTSTNSTLRIQGNTTYGGTAGACMELQSNSAGGSLILNSGVNSSIQLRTTPSSVATSLIVQGEFVATNGIAELNSMFKLKVGEEKYFPSGAGPFNNFDLSSTSVSYRLDLTGVTNGAHFTGFNVTDTYRTGRIIIIYFLSLGGSKTIYIDNLSTNSIFKNQIYCPNNSNISLEVNSVSCLILQWPSDLGRWIVMNSTGLTSAVTPLTATFVHILDGPFAGTSCLAHYQKIGTMVTAQFNGVEMLSTAVAPFYTRVGYYIPSGFAPTYDTNALIVVFNGTIDTNNGRGRIIAELTGKIWWFSDCNQSSFSNVGTVGWPTFSITWYRA